jgi:hypothetical protein
MQFRLNRWPFFRTAEDEALPTTDAALLVDGQLPRVACILARVPPAREEECIAAIEACLASEARRGGWAGLAALQHKLRSELGLAVRRGGASHLLELLASRRPLMRFFLNRWPFFRTAEDEALPTTDAALDGRLPVAARWPPAVRAHALVAASSHAQLATVQSVPPPHVKCAVDGGGALRGGEAHGTLVAVGSNSSRSHRRHADTHAGSSSSPAAPSRVAVAAVAAAPRSLARVPPAREEECVAVIEACLASEARRGSWAEMGMLQHRLLVELDLRVLIREVPRLLDLVSSRQELVRIEVKVGGRVRFPSFAPQQTRPCRRQTQHCSSTGSCREWCASARACRPPERRSAWPPSRRAWPARRAAAGGRA